LFVGLLSYLTFLLFNVKYPLSLGLLAGFTNFIPVIGPLVAGIIIFLVVSIDNFLRALFVLLVFILIQQLESNILTPILTKKFVGLPSALVLIALAIGGTLWGFLGAVLAIPLFGILFEFIRDFLKKKQEEKTVVL
jgi:predicted PurR-regulated permease PerM